MSPLPTEAYKVFRAAEAAKLTSRFKTLRTTRPINILNAGLCERSLDNLDLSSYKNSILIDMNPGVSIWSATLHDKIKPRQHILLEPEVKYKPYLEKFIRQRPNAYWVPVDGYKWDTYFKLFDPDPPSPPWPKKAPVFDPKFVPPEEGANTDLIFTGNLSSSSVNSDRLLAQFLSTCAHRRWVQKFGRVRFLIWVQDTMKVRYIPRGIGGRTKATVIADTVCDIQELASSNEVLHGKGHPRVSQIVHDTDEKEIVEEPIAEAPPKPRNIRPKKVGKKRSDNPSPTLKEIEKALDRIEREGVHVEPKKQGTIAGKRIAIARPRGRDTEPVTPKINRLRERLMKLIDEIGEEALPTDELPTLMRKLNHVDRSQARVTEKVESELSEHLSESKDSPRWLVGMEHPPWYYKDKVKDLAEHIITAKRAPIKEGGGWGGNFIRAINSQETIRGLKTLERPEEVEPPKSVDSDVARKLYQSFDEQWGIKIDHEYLAHITEDDIIAFDRKLLQYHTRKFDPVTVSPIDFWPKTPLALLDFSPKLLPRFLADPNPALRSKHWETFNWMMRSLFAVRAHTVGSALNTVVPGGAHILDNIDPEDAHIDYSQRIRILTPDELVAITKAWETWPFKTEGAYLEEFMGDEIDRDRGMKPSIMSIG